MIFAAAAFAQAPVMPQLTNGPAKPGFDITRFSPTAIGTFETFYVTKTDSLKKALAEGKVDYDTRLLVINMAAGRLALITEQMVYHRFRNELSGRVSVQWILNLHADLLHAMTGRLVNGLGAASLVLLCMTGIMIWWPGIAHWHRSLMISWPVHFPRLMWDLHSALGFSCLLFVFLWGISGFYFAFPQPFNALFLLDPKESFTDTALFWLSELHFGRFDRFTEVLWSMLGLVPAVLSISGVFVCCRRIIYKKLSNPHI
jgi:uncharacterized iron-regulated membrane protein